MSILFSLLTTNPMFDFPQTQGARLVLGIIWLVYFVVILGFIWIWRGYNKRIEKRYWRIFVLLGVMTPLTSLFLGIRLSSENILPPPGLPLLPQGQALMVFAFIPWMLASGLLGPLAGALIAGISGIFLSLWATHNLFTPLDLALMAVMVGVSIQQRYRTILFKILRRPLVLAIILSSLYPLVFIASTSLLVSGDLAIRLDYALSHYRLATVTVAVELMIAAFFAEIVALIFPAVWGGRGNLKCSPTELSLKARFLFIMVPLIFILTMVMMIAAWNIAEKSALHMLEEQLSTIAVVTSEAIPNFLESGQNLIIQLSNDQRLATSSSEVLVQVLEDDLRKVPFFSQLYYFDNHAAPLAGYPNPINDKSIPQIELTGIGLALAGVPFQLYALEPDPGGISAQVSFIAAVLDETRQVRGVLIGRVSLATNQFSQPIIKALKTLETSDGAGLLLDEKGQILYHPLPDLIMARYSGLLVENPPFYTDTSPDGTRRLVFYRQAPGRQWSVVLTLPVRQAQQLAIDLALPIMGVALLLFTIAAAILLVTLHSVTRSMETFATQATHISQGQLSYSLKITGEDELGRLRQAFEKMRLSLKSRLDEASRLLWVSQGVASSLEMSKAVKPVLESALASGACCARIVLVPEIMPGLEGNSKQPLCFEMGTSLDIYNGLDEQLLSLTRHQDRIVLPNLTRPRLLQFDTDAPVPKSLAAMALRHESLFYGTLWIGYAQYHIFSEEEVRYLTTLASQAALAAANARHYRNAEIGRQRLEAILDSTPDPVLVTDQKANLILANPAAWKAIGFGADWEAGKKIDELITEPALLELLNSSDEQKLHQEIVLPDGRVYSATASLVIADGKTVGRVCVFRDITHFKKLDELKSEFVATVSHDLRSPLTLMSGYASMLEFVGVLNDQQISYVGKINAAVETMSHLVSNLLDLGRIEAGIDLNLEVIKINEILDRVIGGLHAQADQKHLQLEFDRPVPPLPEVEADGALLQQAIHNLVENAIKFTESGGKVQVCANVQNEKLVIEVHDTGHGIAPVDQPRIFEKFYRSTHIGQKSTVGTGLGLAIVKSIAERHGGQVWLQSQLGRGSIFYLAIPLSQPKE